MIGGIIGDIAGSIYEYHNIKSKDFELMPKECFFTDDTIMTLAIAKSLLDCNGDYKYLSNITIQNMREICKQYNGGYGSNFYTWLYSDTSKPYNSYGNGSATRIGAIPYVAKDIKELKELVYKVTAITHNHKEGLKGAECTAMLIYRALKGDNKERLMKIFKEYYDVEFTLNDIRKDYKYDVTCQGTVPQAFIAFYESNDFEDAIRNAISIGGDSDTLACITGSIAEAYYGVPIELNSQAVEFLDSKLKNILYDFNSKYNRYIC